MVEEFCKKLANINWDSWNDETEQSFWSYVNNVDDIKDCIDFSSLDNSSHDTVSCTQSNHHVECPKFTEDKISHDLVQEPISNIPSLPEQHRHKSTLSYTDFSNGIEHQHEQDATNHVICSPLVDARNHNSDDFTSQSMSWQKQEVGALEPDWITYPSITSISESDDFTSQSMSSQKQEVGDFEPDCTTYYMVQEPNDSTTNLVQEPITKERKKVTHWTEDEHRLFLIGLEIYGSGNWKDIAGSVVKSKTPTQVASHAQKYFLREAVPATEKKRKRKSMHDITLSDSESLLPHIEQQHLIETSPTPNISIDQCEGMQQEPITKERKQVTHWTEDEHRLFLIGLEKYGRGNWKDIARLFGKSKTSTQVASHAQKFFLREGVPATEKKRKRRSMHDITLSDSESLPHRIEQPHLNEISPTPNIPIDESEEIQQAHRMNVLMDHEEMTQAAHQMPQLNQQNNMPRQMNESTQFDHDFWWMFRS